MSLTHSIFPASRFLPRCNESHAEILTPEAIAFIADLQRTFNERRKDAAERPPGAAEEARRRREAGFP